MGVYPPQPSRPVRPPLRVCAAYIAKHAPPVFIDDAECVGFIYIEYLCTTYILLSVEFERQIIVRTSARLYRFARNLEW